MICGLILRVFSRSYDYTSARFIVSTDTAWKFIITVLRNTMLKNFHKLETDSYSITLNLHTYVLLFKSLSFSSIPTYSSIIKEYNNVYFKNYVSIINDDYSAREILNISRQLIVAAPICVKKN